MTSPREALAARQAVARGQAVTEGQQLHAPGIGCGLREGRSGGCEKQGGGERLHWGIP